MLVKHIQIDIQDIIQRSHTELQMLRDSTVGGYSAKLRLLRHLFFHWHICESNIVTFMRNIYTGSITKSS